MFGKLSDFEEFHFPFRLFVDGYLAGRLPTDGVRAEGQGPGLPSQAVVDDFVAGYIADLPSGYGSVEWYVKSGKQVVLKGKVDV
ncbi:hypothetical protein ACN9M1_07535 [Ralstonia sp. R-29]|uniref:hypothetical protein n=1 Tax=Ralstonia sp. R-29 TaxID=3404059 RepID=UPI003CEB86F8